jgi:hypothetical protein
LKRGWQVDVSLFQVSPSLQHPDVAPSGEGKSQPLGGLQVPSSLTRVPGGQPQ